MSYAAMSDEERNTMNENEREFMRALAVKLEIPLDYIDPCLNNWIFGEPAHIPFLSSARAIGATNLLWRTSHAYRFFHGEPEDYVRPMYILVIDVAGTN
jgi:hypothetical protein